MSEKKARLTKYVLRNATNRDINIGDLRYTIPAKKSRDLLSKSARLDYDSVIKSKESGCISKRLGNSLIEIEDVVQITIPPKIVADPSIVNFPQRIKSYIVIDVEEISEEVQKDALTEENELLQQLEKFQEEGAAPIIAEKEDEKDKTAT